MRLPSGAHCWTGYGFTCGQKYWWIKPPCFGQLWIFFFRGKCTISQFPLIKSHQNHHFTELPPNGLLEHHHVVRWFFPLKYPFSPRDFPSFIVFSHGFPMVFPWFSHGFPMVYSGFSSHVWPAPGTRFPTRFPPLGGHRSTPGLPRHAVREALQSRSPTMWGPQSIAKLVYNYNN